MSSLRRSAGKLCSTSVASSPVGSPHEPSGWLFAAEALHEMGRTNEAYDLLAVAKVKLQGKAMVFFTLAQLAMLLRSETEARDLLQVAFGMGDGDELKAKAMADPELRNLWDSEG